LRIGINVIITGIALLFAGLFYIIITGRGFGIDSLDGITISTIGVILIMIGALLRNMKKVNPIKQSYDELGSEEKD
jgi:uncharacterized membrane protein